MSPDRWEQGSEFAWPELPVASTAASYPWSGGSFALYGSGRDALRGLLDYGVAHRGWRRLWVPAYLCQEVLAAAHATGVDLAPYPDAPTHASIELPATMGGDAVLVVNTFGLRRPAPQAASEADMIEDHTHDLTSKWAFESTAQFCMASLRKTLPVPDGGVLWSPRAEPIPAPPPLTEERQRASASKLSAMLLKRHYLNGQPVSKERFRQLSAEGEERIACGAVAGISALAEALLPLFPLDAWARTRRRNRELLTQALADTPWMRVLEPVHAEATGFSVIVVVDTPERRQRLRQGLVEQGIYPAVLWPLEDPVVPLPEQSVDLSRRILSIHCDFRYDAEDMRRVAAAVRSVG